MPRPQEGVSLPRPVYTLCHRRTGDSYSVSLCRKPDDSWSRYRHRGPARRQVAHCDLTNMAAFYILLNCHYFPNITVTFEFIISSFLTPVSLSLIQFPPPPTKGGITVAMEDLEWLNYGQFLNDVIIDFYLK